MDRSTTRNAVLAVAAVATLAAIAVGIWALLRWLRRPLLPVPRVDLDRLAGTWQVVAGSPAVTRALGLAPLTLTSQGLGLLDLDLPLPGPARPPRRARVIALASDGGGAWKLDGGPLGRELAVLALAPDYSSCVLGSPDRRRALVLSRAATVEPTLRRAYREELVRQGFKVEGWAA